MESDKSYVEVKVSFIHIVVLLAGVIIIGIFLFYLGFQAGKSSARNQILQARLPDAAGNTDEIQLVDHGDKKAREKPGKQETSIRDEIKLHQLPAASEEKKEPIKAKPIEREPYYSVQVGAFSEYANAKNYAAKFGGMGYPTEINTTVKNQRKLYRVRVGNFKTRSEAKDEQRKLEKMENKKFTVARSE
jgi:cell division septation protein DedD